MAAHDYSSTHVLLPPHIAAKMRAEAGNVGDWALTPEGREDDFHVTVLYGLESEDPDEVAKLLENEPPITLTLGKTSLFQNDDADVLKADIHSPDLHRLNKKLTSLPHTNSHPDYTPHATLSYIKPGLGKKWAGSDALSGMQAVVDHVIFSSKNGKKTKISLRLPKASPRRKSMMEPPK